MTKRIDQRPIGSLEALARKLGIGLRELNRLALNVDRHYHKAKWIHKPGKKPRQVYPARARLRLIHERIHDRILSWIKFEPHLKGGVRGRSYMDSAKEHAGSVVLFGQDVDDFYGSISVAHIRYIFQHVLAFPPDVSLALARLCSRKGSLVQGGVASTSIANLALYRTEPDFIADMKSLGARYSRVIDDCNVSFRERIPKAKISKIESSMRSMLLRHGYRPKREKQFIRSQQQKMAVHNLNVNTGVSQPEKKRKALRAGLRQFQLNCGVTAKWNSDLEEQYLRLANRIGQLRLTNPGVAASMRKKLLEAASFR